MTSPTSQHDASKENRLNAIIADYLKRKDAGQPVDHDEILDAHPDFRDDLQSWFSGEALVEDSKFQSANSPTCSLPTDMRDTIQPGKLDSDTASEFNVREFGRYQLLRPLGEGAMGSVYLAKDSTLDRLVALKMPKVEGSNNSEFMLRFTREARAAAALRHENICSVYDAGEQDGVAFITMDYIDGAPLSRFIASKELSSTDSIFAMVHTIADAVGHAHKNGVVHRDLKPGNIIVGGDLKPFVTDFGLARRMNSDDESRITQEGLLIGTPAYMAPEQIKGQQKIVGPRSDIYSLGVILFELLTARLPFEGRIAELLAKSLRDDPPVPSRIRKDLSKDIDNVCLKMLKKDPGERYASMAEVKQALLQLRQEINATCGAIVSDIPEAEEDLLLEKYKLQIESMLKNGQFVEAIQNLRGTATDPAGGSRKIVDWAREKLIAVKKEARAHSPKRVNALLASAAARYKRHDYRGCVELIERVPELRRTDKMKNLLRRAEQKETEAEGLLAEIKTQEFSETIAGLDVKLDQLLRLKPDNEYAKGLQEALHTYRNVPASQRRYCFEAGRLQPLPATSFFKRWGMRHVLTGMLIFVSVIYTISSLKSGQQTLAVQVDDDWLQSQGGTLTLAVDGNQYVIASDADGSEPVSVVVSPGLHSFSVANGDTVVHAPRTFEISRDGRRVLHISPTDIELLSDQETLHQEHPDRKSGTTVVVVDSAEAPADQADASMTAVASSPNFIEVHAVTESELLEWADSLPEGFRPSWISEHLGSRELLFNAIATHSKSSADWKLMSIRWNDSKTWARMNKTHRIMLHDVCLSDKLARNIVLFARTPERIIYRESGLKGMSEHLAKDLDIQRVHEGEKQRKLPRSLHGTVAKKASNRPFRFDVVTDWMPYRECEWKLDMSFDELASSIEEYREKGWRPHLVNSINHSSPQRFFAVFFDNPKNEPWSFSADLAEDQYELLLKNREGQPRCVISRDSDGKRLFSTVWDGGLTAQEIATASSSGGVLQITKPGPLEVDSPGPDFDETKNKQLNAQLASISQVHGANEEQLQRWASGLPDSYRPYWISVRSAGKEALFDALARKAPDQVDWKLETVNFDDTKHYEKVTEGYAHSMINAFMKNGILRKQLLLVRFNPGGQFWHGGNDYIGERIQDGFRLVEKEAGQVKHAIPIHLSSMYLNGGIHTHLCQTYGPYGEGEFLADLSMGELGAMLMKYHKKGWRLHLLAGIRGASEPRFNVVFVKNTRISGSNSNWAVSRRLTVAQYQQMLIKVDEMGGLPRCVTSTIEDGQVIYRVLWDEIGRIKLNGIPILDPLSSQTR